MEKAVIQPKVRIISTLHGEKLYETLCTRKEMVKSKDMGNFFRITADNKDLNYTLYFSEGTWKQSSMENYYSYSLKYLDGDGMNQLIAFLGLVR